MTRTGFVVLMFFAYLLQARAQQDPKMVLHSLNEQAAEYQRIVPSFTCKEIITSTAKRGEKLLLRVEAQAEVRVQREEDRRLEETFQVTNYMGKPVANGGKFAFPLYMSGGLSQGAPSFFAEKAQACYDYSVAPNRIDFHLRADRSPECHVKVNTSGFSILDAEGKLVRGEVRRPRKEAAQEHLASLAQVDYADVRLDDRMFRMPTHVYGDEEKDGVLRTFDAYYTSCKMFTAKTTIRPGDGVVESSVP